MDDVVYIDANTGEEYEPSDKESIDGDGQGAEQGTSVVEDGDATTGDREPDGEGSRDSGEVAGGNATSSDGQAGDTGGTDTVNENGGDGWTVYFYDSNGNVTRAAKMGDADGQPLRIQLDSAGNDDYVTAAQFDGAMQAMNACMVVVIVAVFMCAGALVVQSFIRSLEVG